MSKRRARLDQQNSSRAPESGQVVSPPPDAPKVDVAALNQRAKRGIVALVFRTIVMQLIVLGGDIYLRRRLEPADFGLYAIVQFALGIFLQFGDVGLASALIRQSAQPSRRELSSAWSVQMLVALSITLCLWLGAPLMLDFYPDMSPDGIWVLRALSVDLLLSSGRLLPSLMMERELEYGRLSALEIIMSMSYYVAAIGLAWSGFGVMSLAYAVLARGVCGIVGAHLLRPVFPSLVLDFALIRPIMHFGLRFQLKSIVGFLCTAIAPVYGGRVLGQAGLGYLNMAQQTAALPIRLVEVMARVSFPLFSRLQHEPKAFAKALERGVMVSAMGAVFYSGLVVGLGPNLIQVVFGPKWMPALPLFYVYGVAGAIGFLHPIVAPAIDALGKPGLNLKMMVSWTIAMAAIVAFTTPRWGALGFAVGFSIPVVLGNAFVVLVMKWLVPETRFWPRTGALIVGGVVVALLGRFLLSPVAQGPISFGFAALMSAASFLGVVGLLDRTAIEEIRSLLPKKVRIFS
jgi:PST family polysaccharide transporter